MAEMMTQSNERKWQLVWAQSQAAAKYAPSYYLEGIVAHLEAIDTQVIHTINLTHHHIFILC